MKRILLLGAMALPLAFAGCSTYVGYDDDGYYGPPGYYDGVVGDVAIYNYDRGDYRPHYHHYDGSYHHTDVASRGVSHSSVASVSHASSSHVSGGGSVSHASASVSGEHSGGHGDHGDRH